MPLDQDPLEIAKRAFSEIQRRFPRFEMSVDEGIPVELSITLPIQPGLKYEVNLNLQNRDELHFSVSHFWLEWFPCTKAGRVDAYVAAVSGFLSGEYRIVEHYRGSKCVKAELQSPDGAEWKTIGASSRVSLSLPWAEKRLVVVRNT